MYIYIYKYSRIKIKQTNKKQRIEYSTINNMPNKIIKGL